MIPFGFFLGPRRGTTRGQEFRLGAYNRSRAHHRVRARKKIMYRILAFGIFALLGATSTRAQLVGQDWKTHGDSLLTLDPTTGLQWLNLTETFNQSITDVLPELSAGGSFENFRVATRDEVWGLIQDAGLPPPDFFPAVNPYELPINPDTAARAIATTNLLGETVGRYWGTDLVYGTRGYTRDDSTEALSGFWVQSDGVVLYQTSVSVADVPGSGVWLVRDAPLAAVPEPSSFAWAGVLALGASVIGRRCFMRKKAPV